MIYPVVKLIAGIYNIFYFFSSILLNNFFRGVIYLANNDSIFTLNDVNGEDL